ncbi:MAG: Hpt domain-containing protein [Gammaproteobacteria bacterium]|nr:Hpt domain-containing protein [Gammaproteobacteria bacterium]
MTEQVIDHQTFDELKQTVGADFVRELADTFLEEAPPMIAELRAAFEARAAEPFQRAAHSLKTNANTFGALALGAQARELEQGGLPADATKLDALDTAYAAAAAALRALAHG